MELQITVDDYAYVYVKLAVLKKVIMKPQDLKRIHSYNEINQLVNFVEQFFPKFHPRNDSVIEIERELWRVYFEIIGKILDTSPYSIQNFIRNFLLKYEIWNIKLCILGLIAGISGEERSKMVMELPAQMLGRKELLNELVNSKNLTEFEQVLEKSPYAKIAKQSFIHLRRKEEIFPFECQLDKFYIQQLVTSIQQYTPAERLFLEEYIMVFVDFYNINLLYRALYSEIDKHLIEQYLYPEGKYFKVKHVQALSKALNVDKFLELLKKYLEKSKMSVKIIDDFYTQNPDALENTKQSLLTSFYGTKKTPIYDDIPVITMARIFSIFFNKEREIQEIMTRVVRISTKSELK